MNGNGFASPPPGAPMPAYGLPTPGKRPAWFWIAIAGGCCAAVVFLLLLLVILSIPSSLRVMRRANETTAVQTLRTINSAEVKYNATYPDEGFACSLSVLGGNARSGPPSSEAAHLISPRLARTGIHAGYIFSVISCTPGTVNHRAVNIAYTIAAIPETPGRTGNSGYCINQDNVITVDPTGKWNCTQPLQ